MGGPEQGGAVLGSRLPSKVVPLTTRPFPKVLRPVSVGFYRRWRDDYSRGLLGVRPRTHESCRRRVFRFGGKWGAVSCVGSCLGTSAVLCGFLVRDACGALLGSRGRERTREDQLFLHKPLQYRRGRVLLPLNKSTLCKLTRERMTFGGSPFCPARRTESPTCIHRPGWFLHGLFLRC